MSLESISKNIVVDVADYGLYNSVITAKQGDNGTRFINVTVLNNGNPYSLDGLYPVFRGVKPDGNTVFNECEVENGKVVIELTQQILAAVGISTYELALYESDPEDVEETNTDVATSFPIVLNVVSSAFDPAPMESTDEFQVINEVMHNIPMLAELDDYVDYVQSVIATIGNHTIESDVPADAVFTDTTYSPADASNDGLMSSSDYTKLDGIETGAEVNQNAFSNVTAGGTTIASSSKTDTLNITGTNVTITPDASNKTIEIEVTGTDVETALGYTPASIDPETGKIPVEELPGGVGSVVEASEINGNIVVNGDEMQVYRYDSDTSLLSYISSAINDAIVTAINASY